MSLSERRGVELAPVFAALGDPTRAAILDRLSREGTRTLSDLARDAPISRQAISRHISVLTDAGIVIGVRQGRELRLSLRPEALKPAVDWLAQVSAAWEGALDRLANHVGEDVQ
jgi:DNA-binding transcriptional ArsR family regulator